jgi:hypothetical protein
MSHRSNFVWRENGTITIWYRGGTSAHYISEIAIRGLDYCRAWFREMATEEPFLMNNAWAEGGLMVDVDTKTVLYFGTTNWFNYHFSRTRELEVIRTRWPGWDVRIANRNTEDFARHLDIFEPDLLADTTSPQENTTLDVIEWDTFEYSFPQEFVFSSIQNGLIKDFELNHSETFHVVGLGPKLLEMFNDRFQIKDWRDEEDTYSCMLADYDKKELYICHPNDYDSRHEQFAQESWPGWNIVFHHFGLVFHFTHTGRDPSAVLLKQGNHDIDYLSTLKVRLEDGYELPNEILSTLPEFQSLVLMDGETEG